MGSGARTEGTGLVKVQRSNCFSFVPNVRKAEGVETNKMSKSQIVLGLVCYMEELELFPRGLWLPNLAAHQNYL